ncbi:MAG: S53 family peptidase [Acidobacteriaceae bacterium]
MRFPITGSARTPVTGTVSVSDLENDSWVNIGIWLKAMSAGVRNHAAAVSALSVRDRVYMRRDLLDEMFGANPAVVRAVHAFADRHGLYAMQRTERSRLVQLRVPVLKIPQLFGIQLCTLRAPDGKTYRGGVGEMSVSAADFSPEEAANISGVFGLDNRVQARPFLTVLHSSLRNLNTTYPDYYGLPTGLDGSGQCVAILEFGNAISPAMIGAHMPGSTAVFQTITVLPSPEPPSAVNDLQNEIALDISTASRFAPKAKLAVYFTEKSEYGWIAALDTIIHDTVRRPSVLSISWGWSEQGGTADFQWTRSAICAVEDLLAEAASCGMTVCVSSGDFGACTDCGRPGVYYPASSTFVLSCGGTMIPMRGPASEIVWSNAAGASGGGESSIIARPRNWQNAVSAKSPNIPPNPSPGRLLPDVAAVAYGSGWDGRPVAGTSAAAPLWAALLACANQEIHDQGIAKTVGNINGLLYDKSSDANTACHDVTQVNNKTQQQPNYFYVAGPSWDACSGWGTPIGVKVISSLLRSAQRSVEK